MKHNLLKLYVSTTRSLQSKSFRNYRKLMVRLCKAYEFLDYTRTIRSLIETGQFGKLLELADSLSTQLYIDAQHHFWANQFSLLIRKFPFDKIEGIDPKQTAINKFLKSERKCARINKRFVLRRLQHRAGASKYEYELDRMRANIRYIIGDDPSDSPWISRVGIGPGASIGVHGNATNFARKLLANWSVTPGAYDYGLIAVMSHSQLRECLFKGHGGFTDGIAYSERIRYRNKTDVVRHNKISFVPKTAKTFRSIAVEPFINSLLQKGVDEVLRVRLKRIGIDLSDQSLNQDMARQGSMTDSLEGFVTIDLSSASDSIATEVVRDLLPPDWFYLLDSIRSREFDLDGHLYGYQKFCSMGNGFCFPLETLIFTAACSAVGAGRPGLDYHVYGDDIIVRKRFFEPLVRLLAYLGFSVNTEKTFSEGPFRESCGADWFGGVDVRPYTLDHGLDSIDNIFKILNLSQRNSFTARFFEPVRDFLLGLLPESFRLFRPVKGNPDTGIDSTGDEHLYSNTCRFNKKLMCFEYQELHHLPCEDPLWRSYKEDEWRSAPLLYAALIGSASDMPFTVRRKTRTKVRFVAYSGATSLWLPAAPG